MGKKPLETKGSAGAGTDRIEKHALLRAPRARVWRALTRAEEFGAWFGAKLAGEFVPGSTVRGPITNAGYEHLIVEVVVERVEPEQLLSFRWHPYAIDAAVDYSKEPSTLVTFELEETAEGTALTITESGFDQIPEGRRAIAFRMNDQGWGMQAENLARYTAEAGG